jgi:hypothetical protein
MTNFLFLLWLPIAIFGCHWLGDYKYQVPIKGMAANKKIDIWVCAAHCSIYTMCHLPLILLISLYLPNASIIGLNLVWISIGIFHFLQDWFEWPTSDLLEAARESSEWYKVLYIPIDNGWHILCNWIIVALYVTFNI